MKKIIIFIFSLCFSTLSYTQNTFEKVIDTLGSGAALSIQETFDGGYIYCGVSSYNGNEAIVVKLDSIGTIEWAKVYSGPGMEGATYIEQTPDSGYMVNAVYNSGLTGLNWLLRLDINGDTLWTKTFSVGIGSTQTGNGNSMASINSTLYGLTGYYKPIPITNLSAYFIATIGNGFLLANKIYNTSTFGTEAYAIDKTFNNGFIISGLFSTSASSTDFYLIRTNNFGDTLWTKTYDNSQTDVALAVEQTSDSGFVMAGYTVNNSTFQTNIYIIKTDSIGNTLWTKQYGDTASSGANSIQQTTDGGYIVTGVFYGNIYLLKADANGDTLWTRQFGGNQSDQGFFVRQADDGGYVVCGLGCIGSSCGSYIIKTDSMGMVHSGTGIAELNNPFLFNVYPNPTSGLFTVQVKGIPKSNTMIEIYNLSNQCVYTSKISNNSTEHIDLSILQNGMYAVTLRTEDRIISKKIIIQK